MPSRRLGVASLVTITTLLACKGGPGVTGPGPKPPASVSLSTDVPSATIPGIGNITVTITHARSCSSSWGATISTAGGVYPVAVTALGTNSYSVTCVGEDGKSVTHQTTIEGKASPSPIVAQIVCDQRLGPISGGTFRVYAQRGAILDSADFDNTTCQANIPDRLRTLTDIGRTRIWFDAKDRNNRSHSPSVALVTHDSLAFPHKFTPYPLRFVTPRGVGAGTAISANPWDVFLLSPDGKFSFFFRTKQTDGSYFFTNGAWPSGIPIPVYVRMEDSSQVSASDLALFPPALQEMATEFGVSFNFLGQALTQGVDPIVGAVVYMLSNTSLGSHAQPITGFNSDVIAGISTLSILDLRGQPRITIKHEMGHMLNLGHPAWSDPQGLMSLNQFCACDPRYGHAQPLEVGLFWLLVTIRDVKKESGAQYGIVEAYRGYREIVLGILTPEVDR